jgi:membrane-bound lytic murein transglycosylase A
MANRPIHLPLLLALTLLILFSSCRPSLKEEARSPEEALTPVRFFFPEFSDDLDFSSLETAIRRNFEYLNKLDPDYLFQYGPHSFTCRQVKESQQILLGILSQNLSASQIKKILKKEFLLFRATGRSGNRKTLFTGYFEPVFEGQLYPDETYRYPLYGRPSDLIRIDLSLFREELKGQSITGRVAGSQVIPYYTRKEIEENQVLAKQKLEVAWLKDPVDVAFLQIQGSGRIVTPEGTSFAVGYEGSNGQPYRSIGRYLLEKKFLERDEISMQRIRTFLFNHPELIEEVLNYNPSYVFFKRLKDGPYGNLNVILTPGRSIALDSRLFPKGALGFISSRKPIVDDAGEITQWVDFSRFVLNQDTGGAITGAGRADIFWGSGEIAGIVAGHLKEEGDLFILIKKPYS